MTIGIGGAGSKIAAKLDKNAVLINVSEVEMNKVQGGGRRILARVTSEHGQFKGSMKSRQIGNDAYLAMSRELLEMIRGNSVFFSTGGGTGNGIVSGIMTDLSKMDNVPIAEKTFFGVVLPYAKLETNEFVINTTEFLTGPLTEAIDSGNTGNIVLFSNKRKFEEEIGEDDYNTMLVQSLREFLSIPEKNEKNKLLDGHIDQEDFSLFLSKSYFNHFTFLDYDPAKPFEEQLQANYNDLLLPPESPIEAMFLVEVPKGGDATAFYKIINYFDSIKVSPVYSVIENTDLQKIRVTVALLYSRKPMELVDDFNRISEDHVHAKVQKSVEQYVRLNTLKVNLEDEAKKVARSRGDVDEDNILETLRRLGKL